MGQPLPDSELVVATPERVSFEYQIAGLGTRAIAQILDLLILFGVLAAVFFAALFFAAVGSGTAAYLAGVIGSFVVIFGYFWTSEALWSGQTVGKKVFRLRAVGDRGEPMTFAQAGIRNVVRIIDFLPYAYGVGLVVLFVNGKGKRLGDLAAGTVVVKDSDYVSLWQLRGGRKPDSAVSPDYRLGAPQKSADSPDYRGVSQQKSTDSPDYGGARPASTAEMVLRRIDPDLRRLVTAYARRRPELPVELRAQLAGTVQAGLRGAVPDVFEQGGPLAALDYLADLEGR